MEPTPLSRPGVTAAEIDRDERVLVAALLRRLQLEIVDHLNAVLLQGARIDPGELCDRIERSLTECRTRRRELNDQRIVRRSERRPVPDGLPSLAVPFARNGEYVGEFPDLAAVARASITNAGSSWIDFQAAGLELHLHGTLWTVDRGGLVFVFRPRSV